VHVIVEIVVDAADRPPVGAPIHVEARDISLQDVAAETLGASDGAVRGALGSWLDTVELPFDRRASETTIWAHADVDRDGRVSPGDYITMSTVPIPLEDGARVIVTMRRV
jgi:hypothetical protein